MANFQSLLLNINKLVQANNTIEKEKFNRGEKFNVFDVLGIKNDSEVNLHSAFLLNINKLTFFVSCSNAPFSYYLK